MKLNTMFYILFFLAISNMNLAMIVDDYTITVKHGSCEGCSICLECYECISNGMCSLAIQQTCYLCCEQCSLCNKCKILDTCRDTNKCEDCAALSGDLYELYNNSNWHELVDLINQHPKLINFYLSSLGYDLLSLLVYNKESDIINNLLENLNREVFFYLRNDIRETQCLLIKHEWKNGGINTITIEKWILKDPTLLVVEPLLEEWLRIEKNIEKLEKTKKKKKRSYKSSKKYKKSFNKMNSVYGTGMLDNSIHRLSLNFPTKKNKSKKDDKKKPNSLPR